MKTCHNRLVVADELDLFGCLAVAPDEGGHDDGEKLLPLNAHRELLLYPPALEPSPSVVSAKTNFA